MILLDGVLGDAVMHGERLYTGICGEIGWMDHGCFGCGLDGGSAIMVH